MGNVIKKGSLYLDRHLVTPIAVYEQGTEIHILDTVPGYEILWVVVNGLLIADRCLLTNISWNDLDGQDLVFGKPTLIDGAQYMCRLIRVGSESNEPCEWNAALDAVGENSDRLWHWQHFGFWGQEPTRANSNRRAVRGYNSAEYWVSRDLNERNARIGYRPALEPVWVGLDDVPLGKGVQIWCGQSVARGRLLELTDYDLILKPDEEPLIADVDLGQSVMKLPDGCLAIACDCVIGGQVLEK